MYCVSYVALKSKADRQTDRQTETDRQRRLTALSVDI